MSFRTDEYAQGFSSPVASNPDISGVGVRIAAYAHMAITLVILSSFRNDLEHFRAAGRRTHILSIMQAVASIYQCSTVGLSSLDATSVFAIQNMMGVYGSALMVPGDNRKSGSDLVYRGWWVAYISWVVVAPVRFDMFMSLCWLWILAKVLRYVVRYGRIIARRFGWKPDDPDPSRVKPSTMLLAVDMLGMMAFFELKIYTQAEARDVYQWTYGQILPMLLLSLPMFELLFEVWKRYSPSNQVTGEKPTLLGADTEDPAFGSIP